MPKTELKPYMTYPWDKWFAKKRPFTLVRGIDFVCKVHGMAAQVRNKAYRRKLSVRIQQDENSITVTINR